MNRKEYMLTRYFFTSILIMALYGIGYTQEKSGKLKVIFLLTANQKKLVLRDSFYINHFNETYSISKLKYYVTSFNLDDSNNLNAIELMIEYFISSFSTN